jgi:CubicO group peptidase (beta-lactamase class C family)
MLLKETITKKPVEDLMRERVFQPLGMNRTDMVWRGEFESIRLSYGLGWGLYGTPYGKAFFKEGHDDGWRNYTVCFDDAKTGILIMTNSSKSEGIYKELLETLLKNTYTPIEWENFTPYNSPH